MGILSSISAKITAMRQRHKDKKEFLSNILRAAEDGAFTDEEMNQLQSQFKELELTQDDLKGIRATAYSAALRAAKSDGKITAEEEAELDKIQEFLKIPGTEIAKSRKELARLRLITEIQNGNPPTITIQNVVLQKKEIAHWSEPGSILEERVVKRRYEGGSQGVSFRIAKGISYRVGGHRGHIVTDTAVLPVSTGELIITNRRIIFRGDNKSFNLRLDKLLELNFYSDGVRLTDDKGKPRVVQFSDPENRDVVGATLSYAINNFSE
jgi:hypothetical protein